jgi:hypothetical protein
MPEIITQIAIETRIFLVRGKKVMLDKDLAELYDVPTKALNQAVKRNVGRFPEDFMFQLSKEEEEISRSQSVTLKQGLNIKYLPYAFTENGVAMLSSVLSSEKAVQINIQIMRAFTRIRNLVADHADLRKAIQQIERRLNTHDQQIQVAFAALKGLLQPKMPGPEQIPAKEYTPDEKKKMGFGKGIKKEAQGRRQGRKIDN